MKDIKWEPTLGRVPLCPGSQTHFSNCFCKHRPTFVFFIHCHFPCLYFFIGSESDHCLTLSTHLLSHTCSFLNLFNLKSAERRLYLVWFLCQLLWQFPRSKSENHPSWLWGGKLGKNWDARGCMFPVPEMPSGFFFKIWVCIGGCSLGKGSNNQNGNLRWHLPLGVRPPPPLMAKFPDIFYPTFFLLQLNPTYMKRILYNKMCIIIYFLPISSHKMCEASAEHILWHWNR